MGEIAFGKAYVAGVMSRLRSLKAKNAAVKVRTVVGSGSGDVADDLSRLAGVSKNIQYSLSGLIVGTMAFLSNCAQSMEEADDQGFYGELEAKA